MKRSTVLTGNHGRKQRARANTEADQNLMMAFKSPKQKGGEKDDKECTAFTIDSEEVLAASTRNRLFSH